ncbi:outer membrane protein [Pseudovibrio flavus]|uniref:outer membrane protein n=1 Tax=Pseudovibrio flavus TaxID=2529854 RepID=UPI00211BBB9A|nr:porin family protein [Pseudovibrio flavus]
MRNCKLALATLSTLIAFAGTASAADALRGSIAPSNSMYVGASIGVSALAPSPVGPADGSASAVNFEFDTGVATNVFAGFRPLNNVRLQGELGYFAQEISKTASGLPVTGDAAALYLLGSVYYDLPLTEKFSPYVGVGAGAAFIDGDITVGTNNPSNTKGDDNPVLIVKVSAGASYALSDSIDLFADYSYMQTPDFYLDTTLSGGAKQIDKTDISAHLISAGMRYNF